MYKDKIQKCTLLFKKVISNFKKILDKEKKKGKGKMVKKSFGLTFDKVKNNKDNIKKKTLSSRKKERVIIIHSKYKIYGKPICKNLKAYYYTFPKITLKRGAPLARTWEIVNRNLKKKYVKER